MKIYTKTGDKGTTGLFGGQRVPKNDIRIEAYGTLDELNAYLGFVIAILPSNIDMPIECVPLLQTIQRDLFTIGSHLATPYTYGHAPATLPVLRSDAVIWQEGIIDRLTETLPELRNFILPGGSTTGSALHVARTICRRAERCIVTLAEKDFVEAVFIQYVNRLSDLLFVLARSVNMAEGKIEINWNR